MKIYCVQWNNLPPWADDFVLFTSAVKAKKYWESQTKALRKKKDEELKKGKYRLYVYTPCEDESGTMEPDIIAWYDKQDDYYSKLEGNWEEFLKECKKK